MGILNDELQAKLYSEYNNGRFPVAIKMAYATYLQYVEDPEFYGIMEYSASGNNYQGLDIIIDSWAKVPRIETRVRLHGE